MLDRHKIKDFGGQTKNPDSQGPLCSLEQWIDVNRG